MYIITWSSKINSLSSCSTIRYQLGMVPYWFHCSILFFAVALCCHVWFLKFLHVFNFFVTSFDIEYHTSYFLYTTLLWWKKWILFKKKDSILPYPSLFNNASVIFLILGTYFSIIMSALPFVCCGSLGRTNHNQPSINSCHGYNLFMGCSEANDDSSWLTEPFQGEEKNWFSTYIPDDSCQSN